VLDTFFTGRLFGTFSGEFNARYNFLRPIFGFVEMETLKFRVISAVTKKCPAIVRIPNFKIFRFPNFLEFKFFVSDVSMFHLFSTDYCPIRKYNFSNDFGNSLQKVLRHNFRHFFRRVLVQFRNLPSN
jgi:hypothetical protein